MSNSPQHTLSFSVLQLLFGSTVGWGLPHRGPCTTWTCWRPYRLSRPF